MLKILVTKQYSQQKDNDISQLKGYIEIAQIVELDAQGEQFSGYEHNFKLTLANGKEFIMAAKDNEEKTQWVNALKKRIKKISKLSVGQLLILIMYSATLTVSCP